MTSSSRPWTATEDAALRRARDINALAARIGRSRVACIQRRYKLGLPLLRPPPRPWSAAEDRTLADTRLTLAQVAETIGRSEQACAMRAHLLGIIRLRQALPPDESRQRAREALDRRRAERTAAGLCPVCGRRRPARGLKSCRPCQSRWSNAAWRRRHPHSSTQYARARRARDPHVGTGRRTWTREEDAMLRDKSLTLREIGARLRRSERSVRGRMRSLGLPPRANTSGRGRQQTGPRRPVRGAGRRPGPRRPDL